LVPAFSPLVWEVTWTVNGAVPEPAESVKQGWSLTPVEARAPDPEFVMLKLAGDGLALPTCPAMLRPAGLTVSAGARGVTVSAGARGVTVTNTVALLLESAWLVAITFT
jgi:hypothetical protein